VPQDCWSLLDHPPGGAPPGWQLLLPGGGGGGSFGDGSGSGGRPPALAYSSPSELVARGRLAHQTQSLLLSARLEGGPHARALLGALAAAAEGLAAEGAGGSCGGNGGGRAGREAAEERAVALYRLCHALLGGGGACRVVSVVEEPAAG
jgi:hypothetical protein